MMSAYHHDPAARHSQQQAILKMIALEIHSGRLCIRAVYSAGAKFGRNDSTIVHVHFRGVNIQNEH